MCRLREEPDDKHFPVVRLAQRDVVRNLNRTRFVSWPAAWPAGYNTGRPATIRDLMLQFSPRGCFFSAVPGKMLHSSEHRHSQCESPIGRRARVAPWPRPSSSTSAGEHLGFQTLLLIPESRAL